MHNIWEKISGHPYLIINGLFIALIANYLIEGVVSGQSYAFLLLLYLVMILGIRLDEMNRWLTDISPEGAIDWRLKRIENSLNELRREIKERSAPPPPADEP